MHRSYIVFKLNILSVMSLQMLDHLPLGWIVCALKLIQMWGIVGVDWGYCGGGSFGYGGGSLGYGGRSLGCGGG